MDRFHTESARKVVGMSAVKDCFRLLSLNFPQGKKGTVSQETAVFPLPFLDMWVVGQYQFVVELGNESDCDWMFLKLAEWRDPINQAFPCGQGPLG